MIEVTPGEVTLVRLMRPEVRNAVDRAMAEALAEAFLDFEGDETARVAVLCASGSFCAGAELQAIHRGTPNRLEPDGNAPMGPTRMVLSKPVIAAIEGYAVGGGLELALWCDLRIAAEDAVLGVFCRRWGVPLIDGGTVRLPQIVGLSRALDLILTGRPVDAAEAREMGLVNRVVPSGTSEAVAVALASELAQLPQRCLRNDRRSVYTALDRPYEDAMRAEFTLGLDSLRDAPEGVARFFRRRHSKNKEID